MKIFFQVFCAIFSGILSALAIPNELFNFGSPLFGFVALVPLYIAAKNARTARECAALFALDALVTHILSSYWLANFKDFAVFTLGASAAGTACIEAMAGVLFFCIKSGKCGSVPTNAGAVIEPVEMTNRFIPLNFAAVRVIYEWAKSTGFLAYPWGVLSMSAFRAKSLMQSADIFGVYGITFLMAFSAAAIAECIEYALTPNKSKSQARLCIKGNAAAALALFLLSFFYGQFRLHQRTPVQKTLNAVLVQQNADPWLSSDDSANIESSIELSERGISEFERKGIRPDLVVWSEAVLRYAFPHSYMHYTASPVKEPLSRFIARKQVPFVIGGAYIMDAERQEVANAALVFDKSGFFRGYYGKSHLVPFAEVIPGIESPLVRKIMQRLVGFSNGWTSGGTYTLFDFNAHYSAEKEKPALRIIDMDRIDPTLDQFAGNAGSPCKVRVAVPICFEDAFPDVCGPFHKAGAEVFVNITDDSWSKTDSAEYQHFVVAAFRAVEYRTSLVRSTNAGFTAVIDNKGRVIQSIPLFQKGHLSAEIPVYGRTETVYAQFGNWFVHLILILTVAQLFLIALSLHKARPKLKDCISAELLKIKI